MRVSTLVTSGTRSRCFVGSNVHAERLRVLREGATRRVAEIEHALSVLTNARRDETDDDEHDPEGVTLSSEWSRLSGLRDGAVHELGLIDLALERLDRGTYGVCVSCGTEIPAGRIEARPFAEHCVPCAERRGL